MRHLALHAKNQIMTFDGRATPTVIPPLFLVARSGYRITLLAVGALDIAYTIVRESLTASYVTHVNLID